MIESKRFTKPEQDQVFAELRRNRNRKIADGQFAVGELVEYRGVRYIAYDADAEGSGYTLTLLTAPKADGYVRGIEPAACKKVVW